MTPNKIASVLLENDALFPMVETLSPRLAWMKKNGIVTLKHVYHDTQTVTEWFAGLRDWWGDLDPEVFFMNETAHNGDSRMGVGYSEEDAVFELCQKTYIRLWNEEDGP